MSTPYQDEFTFQFERELWAETSFKLTYINREFRDQFQDYDLNRAPDDLGRCRWATTINNDTVEQVVSGDPDYDPAFAPGDGIYPMTAPVRWRCLATRTAAATPSRIRSPTRTGWNARTEFRTSTCRTPAGARCTSWATSTGSTTRRYVLELVRRQYRSWEMQASYTWSEAKGDGEDFNQALGNDRSLLEDE